MAKHHGFSILYFLVPGGMLLLSACHSAHKINTPPPEPVSIKPVIVERKKVDQPVVKEDTAVVILREKYARFLETTTTSIHNIELYKFIDEWLYTPYLWGGATKKGIDCSAFVQRLYADVYHINVPRTSVEQFFTQRVEPFKNPRYLQEGDLVFFRTIKGTIVSHVGFYLSNDRFVNASSSSGVSIGNLKDPYWKMRFVAAGRIKEQPGK